MGMKEGLQYVFTAGKALEPHYGRQSVVVMLAWWAEKQPLDSKGALQRAASTFDASSLFQDQQIMTDPRVSSSTQIRHVE